MTSAVHIRTHAVWGLLTLALLGCADGSGASVGGPRAQESVGGGSDALRPVKPRLADDVLLVHGAWADGSCWSRVIEALQRDGFSVQAVQLREQSLADDAALVRHAIGAVSRPLVVAGHSYGGFVMSEATAGEDNVVALVFIAAFAPDEGESIGALAAGYPTTPAIMNLVVDGEGNAIIEPSAFVRYFASDLPTREARVLAAVQHPTAVSILGAVAGEPGWRTIPSYYQISLDDEVIDPALQRLFAQRMGARTLELRASHVSLISRPQPVAGLIARAASAR
jgi:pimeloyl-ACP methyl ester carboxylesterase